MDGMGWVSWGIEHITVFKSASDHLKSILTLFWTLSLHKRPFGRDWKYSFGQLDRMGHKAGCSVDINFHLVYVGKVHMQLLLSKKNYVKNLIWVFFGTRFIKDLDIYSVMCRPMLVTIRSDVSSVRALAWVVILVTNNTPIKRQGSSRIWNLDVYFVNSNDNY